MPVGLVYRPHSWRKKFQSVSLIPAVTVGLCSLSTFPADWTGACRGKAGAAKMPLMFSGTIKVKILSM